MSTDLPRSTSPPPLRPSPATSSSSEGRSPSRSKTRTPSVIKETLGATTTENEEGQKQINQYLLKEEIGRGAFGVVHLAVDTTTDIQYAVKEFSKSRLRREEKSNVMRRPGPRGRGRGRFGLGVSNSSPRLGSVPLNDQNPMDLVRGEVAVLKKLNHENVVKLYEVLDDPNDDSLYMVFEMCAKGALMDLNVDNTAEPYSIEQCRQFFRQMILGIEYLHENDICHRDIKPDNLLQSADDVLKIVDFGVSEIFVKGDDRMKKSAGSPAFMAPELCIAHHGDVSGKAADMWSMGVTLYCLAFGYLPFKRHNLLDLYDAIKTDIIQYPPDLDESFKDVLEKLLVKDPAGRLTMDKLRVHPWVTKNGTDMLISTDENCSTLVTEVTEQEMKDAVKNVANIFTLMKAVTKFKRHSRTLSHNALANILGKKESTSPPIGTPNLDEKIEDPGAMEAMKTAKEQVNNDEVKSKPVLMTVHDKHQKMTEKMHKPKEMAELAERMHKSKLNDSPHSDSPKSESPKLSASPPSGELSR